MKFIRNYLMAYLFFHTSSKEEAVETLQPLLNSTIGLTNFDQLAFETGFYESWKGAEEKKKNTLGWAEEQTFQE